jgi:hypothetical protein
MLSVVVIVVLLSAQNNYSAQTALIAQTVPTHQNGLYFLKIAQ